MKRYFLFFIVFWAIPFLSIAQDNLVLWQSTPVTIDGLADEWIDALRYYDNETEFHYGISNDETNLYLCFYSSNQMMHMKIFRAGMKVELKIKSKPKRTVQILYPKQDTLSFQMPNRGNMGNVGNGERSQNPDNRRDTRSLADRFLPHNQTFEAEGFVTLNGIFSIQNENGMALAINWDQKNRMSYEIKIPLKELFGEGYSLEDISTTDIKLKLQIDAMEMPSSSGQRPAGGRPGGGSGQGGGRGSGAGGQSPQDRAFLFEIQNLNYSFRLAK